jgi:hypothetical protein
MEVKLEGDCDADMVLPLKGGSTTHSQSPAMPIGDGDRSNLILRVTIALFCIGRCRALNETMPNNISELSAAFCDKFTDLLGHGVCAPRIGSRAIPSSR